MAAVTIVSQSRNHVVGDRRLKSYVVNVANNGDTLTVAPMKGITALSVDSSSTTAIGATKATNVVTFVTGGAVNNVLVMVIGV